jgi:hypothetical protein
VDELAQRLGPLAAELDAHAHVRTQRLPRPVVMVRLIAVEPAPAETDTLATPDEAWWERVRWPDDAPLPVNGELVTLDAPGGEPDLAPRIEVLSARPTFEPGWIEVELRRGA